MGTWFANTTSSFIFLDYILLGVIGFSGLMSLFRGFFREALSLATWTLAFWASMHFTPIWIHQLPPVFHQFLPSEALRSEALHTLIFMGFWIVSFFLSNVIAQAIHQSSFGLIDRLVGLVFGLSRGLFLILLLVGLGSKISPLVGDAVWKQSKVIEQVKPWSDKLFQWS